MRLFSINTRLAMRSAALSSRTLQTIDCAPLRIQLIPFTRRAGFTSAIFMVLADGVKALKQDIARRWKHHQARITVQAMLALDDGVLDDMNLTRGDLLYVLQTRSNWDPTTRLRLLSVERRSLTRRDYRRRAAYISELVPTIPSVASDKKTPNNTDACVCGHKRA